ncbi:protein of unknown function [Pseudomonas sp. JV551A1]|uniref:Uncharacterized protein n=1 Tax=Pseudomonas inefficax TaxID=2078786 RepID=A0AAQ1P9R2_9PSED|nr:protein of unknown function [Pseudomonas sp. JV551A1]SPO60350.1 protein of unknown function [Pseudomonas inefficax]
MAVPGCLKYVGDSTGLFAGEPAPTGTAQDSKPVEDLWERVHPRKGQYRQQETNRIET